MVFHHQMKHPKVCQKYSAAHFIFNSLLSVSSGAINPFGINLLVYYNV